MNDCLLIQITYALQRLPVVIFAIHNTILGAAGMDYFIISDIDCHMIDYPSVIPVKNHISRQQFRGLNLLSLLCLSPGIMRKCYPKLFKNAKYKSGTVCSLGQAGSSLHIRVPDKLLGIFHQFCSLIGDINSVNQFIHGNCSRQTLLNGNIFCRNKAFLTIK